jgi:hypothetical protein
MLKKWDTGAEQRILRALRMKSECSPSVEVQRKKKGFPVRAGSMAETRRRPPPPNMK